jgi:hypothetical protein
MEGAFFVEKNGGTLRLCSIILMCFYDLFYILKKGGGTAYYHKKKALCLPFHILHL